MVSWLTQDAELRLALIESTRAPRGLWPDGCRGAAMAWLVFVGPSPGGTLQRRRWRRGRTEQPLHDRVWWEPVKAWSPGFKTSMEPLVEGLTGLRFSDSGKLYAVINFDYLKNPEGGKVRNEAMQEGVPFVLEVLLRANPRLIVPMSKATSELLRDSLESQPWLDLERIPVRTRLLAPGHKRYEPLEIWRISNSQTKVLDGSYFVRLPQHPAKPYPKGLARAIGRAVHRVLA